MAKFLKKDGYCLTKEQVEVLNESDLTNSQLKKHKNPSIVASCFANTSSETLSLLSLDFAKYGKKYIVPLEDFETIFLFSDCDDETLETIIEKCELPKFSKVKLLEKYVLNDEINRISIFIKHGIIDLKDINQALEISNQNKNTFMVDFLLSEKNKLETKKVS